MAFIEANFFSNALQEAVSLYAIVPDAGKGPFPVYYLLHGLSDDHTIWMRRTRIECYVSNLPLVVVMPNGFRGFYTDNDAGPAYGRYMLEDVLGFAERTLPIRGTRASRCIGGLSMGGYGAIRLALAHPELFISANSHSGAFAPFALPGRPKSPEFSRMFGPHPEGTAHDVFSLAATLKRAGKRIPHLRIDCGTEDFLLQSNRDFHAHLSKLKIAHQYAEHPGTHEWDFWDEHVREALAFHAKALGLKAKA